MAIQDKTVLKANIDSQIPVAGGGNVTSATLNGLLNDIVDSYEDIIQEYTTVQRDALTPFEAQKIYNTTSNRLEYYSSSKWLPCSQKETVAVDCSANPNYPEALVGDQYIVSVAGIVGGGSGKSVYVGDLIYCISDNAGGNEATVGADWAVCKSNVGSAANIKSATLTIAAADVLQLNSTPIVIIPAVAGKAIQVISGNMKFPFNTTAYATNTQLQIRTQSNTDVQAYTEIDFSAAGWKSIFINQPNSSSNSGQIELSNGIELFVATGNPTAGDTDITVTLLYAEI